MSSLWTPGGEHRVGDARGNDAPHARLDDAAADDTAPDHTAPDDTELDDTELDEAAAAMRAELDEARQRLASVPAAQVVANHAMGLFELAAIHLSQSPPKLGEASLAIDAMGAIVDSVGSRLGDSGPVLGNALSQIRMAFVEVRSQAGQG
jgi:hypothetical protein